MTIVETDRVVTGGVDTHLDVHVAAALDPIGGLLGVSAFETTRAGYEALLAWLMSFGEVDRVGVEGTGSYGAGLAQFLLGHDVEVIEVDRPNRQARSRTGKSDPVDAIEAARAALSGRATGLAKTKDGPVEAIRALLVARRSARDHRIATLVQMRHLVFTAPQDLRDRFFGLSKTQLVKQAAALRPATTVIRSPTPPRWHSRVWPNGFSSSRPKSNRSAAYSGPSSPPPLPASSTSTGWESTWPPSCWSPPVTTHNGSRTRLPLLGSVESHPWRPLRAKWCDTVSTGAATAKPTMPSTGSSSAGSHLTQKPNATCTDEPKKANPSPRSCAA